MARARAHAGEFILNPLRPCWRMSPRLKITGPGTRFTAHSARVARDGARNAHADAHTLHAAGVVRACAKILNGPLLSNQ